MAKILDQFKKEVINHFSSEEEFNIWLNTPEHFFGDNKITGGYNSPKDWLLYSRRKDRLEYAIKTVIELKTSIVIID